VTTTSLQLYEAIVVDAAPSGGAPGHLSVQIPELFGEDTLPVTVAPLFPGWSGGGWQSVPGTVTPDGQQTRVIVAQLGPESFRWIGTSQWWDFVAGAPGAQSGARSGDGRHRVYLSNDIGIGLETDLGGSIVVRADGSVDVTSTGAAGEVRLNATLIHLSDGLVPPIDAYILSAAFFTALIAALAEVVAIGAATIPPVPTPNTAALLSNLTTSLSAGPPYLSSRIFGS
jgi:hypothetical protein